MAERPTTLYEIVSYIDRHFRVFGMKPSAVGLTQREYAALKADLRTQQSASPDDMDGGFDGGTYITGVLVTVDRRL